MQQLNSGPLFSYSRAVNFISILFGKKITIRLCLYNLLSFPYILHSLIFSFIFIYFRRELRWQSDRLKNVTGTRSMEAFHYVSYIPYGGRLFELDGLKPRPIDHGLFSYIFFSLLVLSVKFKLGCPFFSRMFSCCELDLLLLLLRFVMIIVIFS